MESPTQSPSSITTRIKGASVTIDVTREDDDYYYGVLNGKEYKRKKRKTTVPKFDRELIKNSEAHAGKIIPERTNPICTKCGMDLLGARHPYLPASGPDAPLITLVLDGVSKKEDEAGMLGSNGPANFITSEIIKIAEKFKLKLSKDQIRVSTLTRCARCTGPKQDFKTKGRWCRHFLVQDIQDHRPRVIIPVGSAVLGLLCHKSSAPDWAGRILTYRGWPDDWITTKYATRPHPVFGLKPEMSVPMVPIMNPGMVWAMQSQSEIVAWRKSLKKAVLLACNGSAAPDYTRSYFELTVDPARVREVMVELINHPAPRLTFDTETSGLKQYSKKQTIVYMMFRWDDGNVKRSIGFPWDYEGSPLKPYLNELSEYILRAVYANKLCGHNLTFDMLWLHATLPGADLDKLANAMDVDTMHMLYALKQARGSRGLELVAYDWCPEMAGYEEEMVLFIEKYSSLLAPDEGGHYANWSSLEATEPKIKEAFKAYIMGDVEVAHVTANRLEEKLQEFDGYQIPLASIKNRGKFRLYTTPSRSWVFHSILCPAARTLYKMMARGMHVNEDEVAQAEDLFPKRLTESIETLVRVDPRITDWVASQRATIPDWEFDLEKSDQLKTVLFNLLGLEVQRLTETGIKIFGDLDHCTSPEDRIKYAATDKYTLTRLISEHPSLKPLQDYKKLFKAYSGYVRPMRNSYLDGFDKKERSKYQHLMPDGCVHGSFLLTGTRGGRLASKDPNLQQLPHDGDVKKFYDSRFGKRGCLYNGDLSQIELRLLAAACGDPVMVKAYCDGVDLHTLTTSRIFHTDYEVYTKKHMAELQEQGHGDIASKLDMQRKIGKCVDPDTLINVNGSIKRFGSICDGRQPDTFYDLEKRGLFVDSPSGKVRINKFYCNGVAQTVIVCTKKGIVRCSTIHRFLTKDGRLIMAKDLKKGDVLADAVPLIVEHPKDAVIDYNPFGKKSICDKNPVKIHVSDDLAYLLGLFYGDGCTGSGLVAIATGGKSEFFTWQDQIADVALHCGFEPRIDRTLWDADRDGDKKPVLTPNGDEYVVHGSCGRVVLGSTRVSDFFMQLGAINDNAARSKTLEIPEWMFNSCDHTRLEFLAGLFDTDGSTSRGGAISWSTKSWKFCQDVMVMLRSLGIWNSLELSWNKTYLRWYYRLSLSKTDSYSFFKDKLRLKYKNDRLTAPRFQYRHELPNAVLGVIPSGDDLLVEINVNREDHLYCANMLTMRNTTNFLTGYGGGPAGLQGTLAENGIYISLDESEKILEGFFESYPTLTQYLSEYKKFVLKNGVAVSITGRVREFNEVFSDDRRMVNKALRAGCNHLIQSTASDMMLTALNAIEFIMRQENMESMLVSTVHDSLLIDAVRNEMPRIHEICNEILNNIPGVMQVVYGDAFDTSWTTLLPFNGDFDIGNNYLDMIKVPENPDWNEIWKRIDNTAA
jgi:DNA polymerase I-like protein with 3'-5' exonuclease and polymerase domains/uracil-DNA glycosylase